MTIPKVLKIAGHYVTVKLVDKTTNGNCGEWDPMKNQIEINNTQPTSQQEETLVHEILHALNISMEEEKVEFLAQGIYQVFSDNKLNFDGKTK